MPAILNRIKRLSPTDFENLVYDLAVLRGLRNATWRTPGADGGRDIEGTATAVDLAGRVTVEKWYVECKRYKASVDWPTVREKIAYAENHRADYLLLCTTASLSPQCKDELAVRESRGERPRVRFWDGADLESLVAQNPVLLVKYQLSRSPEVLSRSLIPIVLAGTKAVQAAYGRAEVADECSPELELGAALVDLIAKRIAQAEAGEVPFSPFSSAQDSYAWLSVSANTNLDRFDAYAVRAVACAVRLYGRVQAVSIQRAGVRAMEFRPAVPHAESLSSLLRELSLWSNCEIIRSRAGLLTVTAREP